MGARTSKPLSSEVTHLVVNRVGSPKYIVQNIDLFPLLTLLILMITESRFFQMKWNDSGSATSQYQNCLQRLDISLLGTFSSLNSFFIHTNNQLNIKIYFSFLQKQRALQPVSKYPVGPFFGLTICISGVSPLGITSQSFFPNHHKSESHPQQLRWQTLFWTV